MATKLSIRKRGEYAWEIGDVGARKSVIVTATDKPSALKLGKRRLRVRQMMELAKKGKENE